MLVEFPPAMRLLDSPAPHGCDEERWLPLPWLNSCLELKLLLFLTSWRERSLLLVGALFSSLIEERG